MKSTFIYISICFLFVCCNKQTEERSKVESFIEVLKEDSTERIQNPDFVVEDIAELLSYRNEGTIITNFERNLLSSFYLEEVQVGMYVLWTIESVRLEAIDDPDYYLFASLNPRIGSLSTGVIVDQDSILTEVAQAYADWWSADLPLEEKLAINPLESLDLRWN